MITRQDYLNKAASHREFYAQFVDAGVKQNVLSRIGLPELLTSTDKHFNDIPLKRWDCIWTKVPAHVASRIRETGDYPTLSSSVCILKEAARQIVEAHNA